MNEPLTHETLPAILSSVGLETKFGKIPGLGTASHQGIELSVCVGDGPDHAPTLISINMYFGFPKQVPLERLEKVNTDPRAPITFQTSISGAVSASISFTAAEIQSKDMPDRIAALYSELDAFKRKLLKPLNGWSVTMENPKRHPLAPLNPRLSISSMSGADAWFLISKWGWQYHGAFGASTPTWVVPSTVRGTNVNWIGMMDGGLEISANFPMGNDLKPSQLDVISSEFPHGRVAEYSPQRISFLQEIKLGDGIQVSEIKKKIESFATTVAKIAKQNGFKSQ